MAEEVIPTATQTTTTPEPEKTVPYDRFKQVNDKAAEQARQLAELQGKLQELEDRDASEVEKATKAAQREAEKAQGLEAQLQETRDQFTRLERSQWVRNAASDASFIDSQDALGRVNLAEIESEADAKRAVRRIAENASHLVRQETPSPQIGQVLQNGQAVPPQTATPQAGTPVNEADEKCLADLKAASGAGWVSAGTGLLDD